MPTPLGTYQHYKGSHYEVIANSKHSDTLEQVVVYKSLETGLVWHLPQAGFNSTITVNGERVPRFTKVKDI